MAIIVLSIAGLALMESFTTTITGSAQHRSLASNDLVLRAAAESAFSLIEQQTSPIYSACVTPGYGYTSLADQYTKLATAAGDANFGAPSPYSASISLVQFWNSTNDTWSSTQPTDCTSIVPELITLTVTNKNLTTESTSFTVNNLNAASGSTSTIVVASISPRQIPVGASSVPVTITGSGFSLTSSVSFSNSYIGAQPSSTPNTSTSITVLVTVPLQNVSPGTYDVIVTTPASGSTPSSSGTGTALLQVTANAHVIGIDPKYLSQTGLTGGTYTLYGTDFEAGMGLTVQTATGGDSGVTASNINVTSPTTATLTLSASGTGSTPIVTDANGVPLGDAFVVSLPGTVTSTSSPILQIIPPPSITSTANSSGGASPCDPGFDGTAGCIITGANFESGATVTIQTDTNGNQVGVVNSYTFVSSQEIDINVSGTGTVQGESATVVVTNPDGSTASLASGFTNG
jgi:hypothetical protein